MSRRPLILAAVGVLAVLALAFFVLIKPRRAELRDVRAETEREMNRSLELRAERDRLRQLQENAPRLQAVLQQIRKLVPKDDAVPNFVFQVQQAANAAGLRFVKIDPEVPQPPVEGATVAEVRATIGARGGYFTIQDFVRRLYRLDRAVRIDILNLAPREGEEGASAGEVVLDLEATARIFFELPAAAAPTATSAPSAPAATPAPAASPSPAAAVGGG